LTSAKSQAREIACRAKVLLTKPPFAQVANADQ
jgi:hypothetical protein